jgi:ankyrin repeat protein
MSRKQGSAMAAQPTSKYHQLLEAIWRDKSVLQRHLEDHTIDEPQTDAMGDTLLHVAVSDAMSSAGSSDTLVKQLLQAGADCNLATRSEGFTALMLARTANVAIERECNGGCTALYFACAGGRLAVAKVLLKRGAVQHILKSTKTGTTPLCAAFTFHHLLSPWCVQQHGQACAEWWRQRLITVLSSMLQAVTAQH